jgi:hypothetical protein
MMPVYSRSFMGSMAAPKNRFSRVTPALCLPRPCVGCFVCDDIGIGEVVGMEIFKSDTLPPNCKL